MYDLEI